MGAAFLVVLPGAPVAVAVTTCDPGLYQPLEDAPTVKVLVVGDSLTQEFNGDYTWRYRFWQAERARGVNIDFVGPLDTLMPTWDSPSSNTLYADPCFDQREHLAIGGRAMAATLAQGTRPCPLDQSTSTGTEVAWATACYQPDVVVGFMGYNDLKRTADGGLGRTADQLLGTAATFVTEVQHARPGTPVAVANVLSTKAPQVVVDAAGYNAELAAAVPTWSSETNPVRLIDVTKDWKYAPEDTWDGYHPNANGEMHLAWDVADGLHALDLVPALERPIPVQPLGPRAAGTVSLLSRTPSSATLAWTFPVGANREILSQRDVTSGGEWTTVHDEPYARGATVTGLAAHRYEFRVQAAQGTAVAGDVDGNGLYSAVLTVDLTHVPVPPAVPHLVVNTGYHAVRLTWGSVSGAQTYSVAWRRAGSTAAWQGIVTAGRTATVTGLVAGQPYAFVVRVATPSIGTATSRVATPTGVVLPAPRKPRVRAVPGHRVALTWNKVRGATRYQVQVRSGGASWRVLRVVTPTRLTTRPLVKGHSYQFRIRPYHQLIAGHVSPAARVTVR